MTPQEVYDNWSAYLRGVDRADFLEQLKAIAPPSAIGRTDADYAIEFGGYLAKAAEDFLAARDRFIELDEGDEVLAEGALADAEEAVSDHHAGLREAIYEFRKRAERAKAAPSTVASTNAAPQGAGLTVSNPASTDETSSPAGAAPTPRTDAHLAHLNLPDGRKVGIPNETLDLLRQLERELAEERDHHTQTVQSQDDRMLAEPRSSTAPTADVQHAIENSVSLLKGFYGTCDHSLDVKVYREQLEKVAQFEKVAQLASRSATRHIYAQGERVIVATPSGHLEEGIVHEDLAAIWVKHDSDGVLRVYKPGEVSPVVAATDGRTDK